MHAWFLLLPSHNKGEGSEASWLFSLNRSNKDSENKVGLDFYLDISFDDLELTDSFLEKEGTGSGGMNMGEQAMAWWGFCFTLCVESFRFSGMLCVLRNL